MITRQLRDQKAPGGTNHDQEFCYRYDCNSSNSNSNDNDDGNSIIYTRCTSIADQLMRLCVQKKLFKSQIVQ